MQILLMWRNQPKRQIDPNVVGENLKQIFFSLLADKPVLRFFSNKAATILSLEIPVEGWIPENHEEDERTWAMALDYPVDARDALASVGQAFQPGPLLPPLCRHMRQNPAQLLEQISPPYALIWGEKGGEEVCVQNDGLGHAQLFEYDDGKTWAVSNRIFAFKALGIHLKPIAKQWAVRSALGWFPLDMTGYKHVRFPNPATQIHITPNEITRTSFPVLEKWIQRDSLRKDECLELASESLKNYVRAASSCWTTARAGLTGGWDSRTVASVLIAMQSQNVRFRVRGQQGSYDVEIASALAKEAGVPILIDTFNTLPPEEASGLELMARRAMLWQAGYIDWHKHKLFPALNHKLLGGGGVNIMGQYGEIARGYYASRIRGRGIRISKEDNPLIAYGSIEDALLVYLTKNKLDYMTRKMGSYVGEVIRAAYRQANAFGLHGLDKLDFFYLYERTRRWASGTRNVQPGKVISPFLTPGFIRATYNLHARTRLNCPLHRHITARHVPAWGNIDYLKAYTAEKTRNPEKPSAQNNGHAVKKLPFLKKLQDLFKPPISWRVSGTKDFDPNLYWMLVGKDLIDNIRSREGLWTQIYRPERLKDNWLQLADDLSVLNALHQVLAADKAEDWREFGGPR